MHCSKQAGLVIICHCLLYTLVSPRCFGYKPLLNSNTVQFSNHLDRVVFYVFCGKRSTCDLGSILKQYTVYVILVLYSALDYCGSTPDKLSWLDQFMLRYITLNYISTTKRSANILASTLSVFFFLDNVIVVRGFVNMTFRFNSSLRNMYIPYHTDEDSITYLVFFGNFTYNNSIVTFNSRILQQLAVCLQGYHELFVQVNPNKIFIFFGVICRFAFLRHSIRNLAHMYPFFTPNVFVCIFGFFMIII